MQKILLSWHTAKVFAPLQDFFAHHAFCCQVNLGAVSLFSDTVDALLGLLEIAHVVVNGVEHYGTYVSERDFKLQCIDLPDKNAVSGIYRHSCNCDCTAPPIYSFIKNFESD